MDSPRSHRASLPKKCVSCESRNPEVRRSNITEHTSTAAPAALITTDPSEVAVKHTTFWRQSSDNDTPLGSRPSTLPPRLILPPAAERARRLTRYTLPDFNANANGTRQGCPASNRIQPFLPSLTYSAPLTPAHKPAPASPFHAGNARVVVQNPMNNGLLNPRCSSNSSKARGDAVLPNATDAGLPPTALNSRKVIRTTPRTVGIMWMILRMIK